MSVPLVTIVIPSYNHGQFIEETLRSVQAQTYDHWEALVIDDASSDDSVKKVEAFLSDKRIQLITREKNIGASYASNEGISRGKGKYFSILSSDDRIRPEKLKSQVAYLESNPDISAVFSMVEFIDETGRRLDRPSPFKEYSFTRHQWLNHFFYHGNCLCHPSMLIRKDLYKRTGYYKPMLSSLGDFDLWVRLVMAAEIKVMPDITLDFRLLLHEQNTSGDNLRNRNAVLNEWVYILSHFLAICDAENFPKVFPNLAPVVDEKNDFEFLLAKEAAGQSNPSLRAFGLQLLYQIFSDHDRAKNIEKVYQFRPIELIKLSQETDTYSREEVRMLRSQIKSLTEAYDKLANYPPIRVANKIRHTFRSLIRASK